MGESKRDLHQLLKGINFFKLIVKRMAHNQIIKKPQCLPRTPNTQTKRDNFIVLTLIGILKSHMLLNRLRDTIAMVGKDSMHLRLFTCICIHWVDCKFVTSL